MNFLSRIIFKSLIFFSTINLLSAQTKINLPIEVVGEEGIIKSAYFEYTDLTNIEKIIFTIHNLSYEGKGSFKLNGSEWINFNNENVVGQGKLYGGIGGYKTLKFKFTNLNLNLKRGRNRLAFRFNFSDGISIGYRVLKFQMFDSFGNRIFNNSNFTNRELEILENLRYSSSKIKIGDSLWHKKNLWSSYKNDRKRIKAKCASCHAPDGSDLKYFNFSLNSIVKRSKFHGLTYEEGVNIAHYIRSLSSPSPKQARVYNPPYQPGKGLDARPFREWAAGAGLESILQKDEEMYNYLFPKGLTDQGSLNHLGIKSTLNMRELPIALQLPDWNSWLPKTHPLDIYGVDFTTKSPYLAYLELLDYLNSHTISELRQNRETKSKIENFILETHRFVGVEGAQPCKDGKNAAITIPRTNPKPGFDCEDVAGSLMHWMSTKLWYIMTKYKLEQNLAENIYQFGEKRSWVGKERSVFDLAPHRISNNAFNLKNQTRVQDAYFNTAWYQLELILNSVNRSPQGHKPIDWKYHFNHIYKSSYESGDNQSLRYLSSLIKMWQTLNTTGPNDQGQNFKPNTLGWWLHHVHPSRLYLPFESFLVKEDEDRLEFIRYLDKIDPNIRKTVLNMLFDDFVDKTVQYKPEDFKRGYENFSNPVTVESIDYIPTNHNGNGNANDKFFEGGYVADQFYRTLPRLDEEIGLKTNSYRRLIEWCKIMWPKGNWDRLMDLKNSNKSALNDQLYIKYNIYIYSLSGVLKGKIEESNYLSIHSIQDKYQFKSGFYIVNYISEQGKKTIKKVYIH